MSDSATLLAYLQEHAQPDGTFSQNAQTTSALLGWYPDQLSAAFQALAADGLIEATHDGGDPAKIHGSSWRVLADGEEAAETDVAKMNGKQLRAYADANDIELPEGRLSVAELREYVEEARAEAGA